MENSVEDELIQEFHFSWQNTYWNGMEADHKAVYSFVNYGQANEENDIYVYAEFRNYVESLFSVGTDTTDPDQHKIWINITSLYPILGEVYEQSFTRDVYITTDLDYPLNNRIRDLPEYSQTVNYILYDCSKDFEQPDNFIQAEENSDFSDSVIDFNGQGTHFILFHEEGIDKIYLFNLSNLTQNYQAGCGDIAYEVEVIDSELQDVF